MSNPFLDAAQQANGIQPTVSSSSNQEAQPSNPFLDAAQQATAQAPQQAQVQAPQTQQPQLTPFQQAGKVVGQVENGAGQFFGNLFGQAGNLFNQGVQAVGKLVPQFNDQNNTVTFTRQQQGDMQTLEQKVANSNVDLSQVKVGQNINLGSNEAGSAANLQQPIKSQAEKNFEPASNLLDQAFKMIQPIVDNPVKTTENAIVNSGAWVLDHTGPIGAFVKSAAENFYNNPVGSSNPMLQTISDLAPSGIIHDDVQQVMNVANSVGKGIIQGVLQTTFNSSDTVHDFLNTETNKNITFQDQAINTIGKTIGVIGTFLAGGEIAGAAGFAEASGPIIFGTLGQTSLAPDTSGETRKRNLFIDTLTGGVSDYIESFKVAYGGGSAGKILSAFRPEQLLPRAAVITAQTYLDLKSEGATDQQALDATKNQALFIIGLSGALGLIGAGKALTESDIHQGGVQMTPQDARSIILNSNLENTQGGQAILQKSIEAEQQGKDLFISGVGAKQSPLAKGLNLKTPDGATITGIDLIDKQEPKQLEGKTVTEGQTQGKEKPVASPEQEVTPEEYGKRATEQFNSKPDAYVNEYINRYGNEVNTDLARNLFAHGGDGQQVQEAAGNLSKQVYTKLLNENEGKGNDTILTMAGGPGSGKSSSLKNFIPDKSDYSLIYDSTLSENAVSKIQEQLDHGYKAHIAFTLADPVQAFERAVGRAPVENRAVNEGYFLKAHINARNEIVKLYEKYKDNPNVDFLFIDNTGKPGEAKEATFEKVKDFQYNEQDAKRQIQQITDKAHESGAINDTLYHGFTKTRQGLEAEANKQPEQVSNPRELITQKEQELKTTYGKLPSDQVEESLYNIFQQLETAQAGKRMVTRDTQTGEVLTTLGQSSSFPSWVPEDLRSRKLFDQVLTTIQDGIEGFHYPNFPFPTPKLHSLIDTVFDQLDQKVGVDTKQIRSDILNAYAASQSKANQPGNNNKESVNGREDVQNSHSQGGQVQGSAVSEKSQANQTKNQPSRSIEGTESNQPLSQDVSTPGGTVGAVRPGESVQPGSAGISSDSSRESAGEPQQRGRSGSARDASGVNGESVSLPSTLQQLAEEAKKYKSAKEFVNSRPIEKFTQLITGKTHTVGDYTHSQEAVDLLKKNGFKNLEDFYNKTVSKPKYDYQSTQLNLPKQEATKIALFQKQIPENEVSKAPDQPGKEKESHITVLYGLDNKLTAQDIEKVVGDHAPIEVTLGKTSLFKNDEYDVLKVDVHSKQLQELNKKIADNLEAPGNKFSEYKPHVTIAYLEKGAGEKYANDTSFEGDKLTLHELSFSKNDGEQVTIPLGSKVDKNPKMPEKEVDIHQAFTKMHSGVPIGSEEFIEQDLKPFVNNLKEMGFEIHGVVNPKGTSKNSNQAADIIRQGKAAIKNRAEVEASQYAKIRNYFNHFNDEQNIKNIAHYEKTGEFLNAPSGYSQLYTQSMIDSGKIMQQVYGEDKINLIENYVRRAFVFGSEADESKGTEYLKHFVSTLSANKSPTRGRVLDMPLDEAFANMKERDIKVKMATTNPEELRQWSISNANRALEYKKIWTSLKGGGLIKFVTKGSEPPVGYVKLNDKAAKVFYPADLENGGVTAVERGSWMAQPDVARVLNNTISQGLDQFATFKGIRQIENIMNSLQLGLSAFHLTASAINASISDLAVGVRNIATGNFGKGTLQFTRGTIPLASFLTDVYRGQTILSGLKNNSPKAWEFMEKRLNPAGGRLGQDERYRNQAYNQMIKALQQGNILGAAIRIPKALLEITGKPLMEFAIPRVKLAAFMDLADSHLRTLGKDATPDEQRHAMAKAWDSIDNRFGQLVYDNLFWNKVGKDLMMTVTRSVGWNLGTLRELGGGAVDLLGVAKGEGVSDKTLYSALLPLYVGLLGAIYMYLHTGKRPQQLKDYFDPENGQIDKNGNPIRVTIASYMKDVFSYSSDPIATFLHKSSPLLNYMSSLISNNDYLGNMIRNPKDPIGTQLSQIGAFTLNNILPFAIQQAFNKNTQGSNTQNKIEAFFGITQAPQSVIQSDKQKAINDAYSSTHGQTTNLTPEQQDINKLKAQARTEIQAGHIDDSPSLNKLIQMGAITKGQSEQSFIRNSIKNPTGQDRAFQGLNRNQKNQIIQKYGRP